MPYLNFKELAAALRVEDVADYLAVELKRSQKELRGKCPACDTEDERALAIMPETNSFRCYAAQVSGDCIALCAHINGTRMFVAAKELAAQFHTANAGGPQPNNSPAPPQKKPQASKQERTFNAEEFASKLTYSKEVEALGISEADAQTFGAGFYRGHVYLAARYPSGIIAGFWKQVDGRWVPPAKWLPDTSNVVQLRRPA